MNNSNANNIVLPLDALIRSIGVNKATSHLIFLGSGASVSSGVPSAEQCIWEWKRNIFLTKTPGLEEQFSEISLAGVRQRIQKWFDQQGTYPREGDPDEYGFYMEACFPIPGDRRSYFQEKVRQAEPHIGYRLLCHLALSDMLRAVWTTNFDTLAARSAAAFKLTPIEVGIDSQHRLFRVSRKGELLCVSLHGDFRYDRLKNTAEELQQQEKQLKDELIRQIREAPTLIAGYSGRDQSIMAAFREAYSQSGTGSLYWCGYGDSEATKRIADLIHLARTNGYPAFYIPTEGFDDLLIRITLHCCENQRLEEVKQLIAGMSQSSAKKRSVFEVADALKYTVIKSNAFELECPSEVLTFDLEKWPTEKVWATIRDTVKGHSIVAAPFRGKVLALGIIDDIKDAFGDNIRGHIERTPVTENELRYEDGVVVSLMKEALVQAIASSINVKTDNQSELWIEQEQERLRDGNTEYSVYDSVLVFLRRIGSRQYLVLKPSLRIQDKGGQLAPQELDKSVKFRILGRQFNNKFFQAVTMWRERLFPATDNLVNFVFPNDSASSFRFRVRRSPVFAEIGTSNPSYPTTLPAIAKPLVHHRGFELAEPNLLFSDKSASRYIKDPHPIRGILSNRPFDFGLTQKGLASSVRLGIVCPHQEARKLRTYMDNALRKQQPLRADPEYLMEYPGFDRAYGLTLEIPDCQGLGWATCPEPGSTDPIVATRDVAHRIIQSIDSLMASYGPQEVLIFVPKRWSGFRAYRTENERFDVHDFVKAYCVQRGIPTQFLEEDSLTHEDQCSVWWWLSLAMYVKSMRTPWVLESLDADTAFVGLGFSVDPYAQRRHHIILGCSHIYSSRGEGLQFRLSKIENPIFLGRNRQNPFMSEEDARRLGETIRQLFFDAKMKLPRRVVIHKQTPFIEQEREGLCEGLAGVGQIEMLEIQIDHALRYVASVWKNGRFDEDNFPVRRGTTVKLDDFTSLVWVHGATSALNPPLRYFQGRRRIPAPIIMRRHLGESELRTVAQELLGLSKMNWNTFDLYTKLPATVYSSSEIARIGSLLQRFGPQSYDFRLFM